MIRVLIADGQRTTRAGLRRALADADGIEVVAEVADGESAVAEAIRLQPDVCLFDLLLPTIDGVEATRLVVERLGRATCRVIVLDAVDVGDGFERALTAGAISFLARNTDPETLVQAIRGAVDEEGRFPPEVAVRVLRALRGDRGGRRPPGTPLTEREEEVLAIVCQGLTNAEIAARLNVSLSTVKTHLAQIMDKLGARNRVELVIWAFRTGRAS